VARWTVGKDLSGTRAIVTGANSGLGLETARELARARCAVVLACRSAERGRAALENIRRDVPDGDVTLGSLDLADLGSVRAFAAEHGSALDLLVNNAGVMALPRRTTADGFEMQFGTNHLGHFALTGLLLPALLERPGARVVTVTSPLHWAGRLDFADLDGERHYRPYSAYCQSKLANLVFAKELHRRAGGRLLSVAAHPGYAATNLQQAGPRMRGSRTRMAMYGIGNTVFAQSAAAGAWPLLYAATAPDVRGGDCYGPRGQLRGAPHRVMTLPRAASGSLGRRLWEISEERTGVTYDIGS
jgi:NAD(P)-dependent dehydrogenase (short-subunit alcohol dehydrogenase family)